ncbi:AAA family ATPase [Enterobacteriaceae bacterium C23F]
MMGVYGATVGAGTLFLPVEVGARGPQIFILLLILGLPLSLLPHVLICRVLMRDGESCSQTLPMFGSYFGSKGREIVKLFFCVAHYPVTLVYAVSLINALSHLLTERFHFPGLNRWSLTLVVLALLHLLLLKGRDRVVKTMSVLALPFAAALLMIAAWQIPHWDVRNLTNAWQQITQNGQPLALADIWLTLPLISFSLCCAPLIPALASWYRESDAGGEEKAVRVVRIAYALIFISVTFFVLSCILSMPANVFIAAKKHNLNVLSVIGGDKSMLMWLAPFIAIIGMSKSFLGISMPVAETFSALCASVVNHQSTKGIKRIKTAILVVMFCITTVVVWINPDVINLIETVCGPLIAVFLFLIPSYLIFRRWELKPLRGIVAFISLASGIATLSALIFAML